ncbi:tetratricopeptide repeat protein [Luteimonas sp. SX5]|uniref:Tetratricopeptide repeat protein n=1 Tax=Luteimonas galliterrae TaxID=2940486 RepID=A0ABT0MIU4_9GAMM|nr:tetratricopeptide repeat protein [Luteimonas galliterrae]MCL1634801.1 tetratricopeptide repeat protein [Luteimonas galliterrae]
MKLRIAAAAAAIFFVAGIGVGYGAKLRPTPQTYRDKAPQEAAQALLLIAQAQSGKNGSWERIGAGRVYYLGGFKAQGQEIFDHIFNGKHEDSDEYRIARVYAEAGDWQKAKPIFDRYLTKNPKDARAFAEVAARYLLQGDRTTAEQLFDRAIDLDDEDPWVTEPMAGAYLGVKPQE